MEADKTDSNKFDNCYQEFRKTLDIEKHLERKMSDLDLDFDEECQQNTENKII